MLTRRATDELFGRLFSAAPNAMLLIAADGRVVEANRSAQAMLGYAPDELLGLSVDRLVPRHRQSDHKTYRESYFGTPTARAMGKGRDLAAVRRDRSEVPVEIGLNPVDTEEGPMVIVALNDISERLESERLLQQQADALARSNEDLEAFAYIASHDLRSPLRGIDQLAGFIDEDAGASLPEESRQDLDQIRTRVRRLERLLDDLLSYSRIGRKESTDSDVDLTQLLTDIAELYCPDTFEFVCTPTLPCLRAPKPALDLVFRNLVMNSVKHHDREHGRIEIGWEQDVSFVHLSVSDDGPGIPPEYRERVFRLFQTLDTRDKKDTSGMGLTIVKKTLEIHGGCVEVLCTPGRGAVFRISLPIDRLVHPHAALPVRTNGGSA